MNATELVARLDAAALTRLASLALDEVLEQKVEQVVTVELAVRVTRVALEGWLQTPAAEKVIAKLVEDAANALAGDGRALREVAPSEVKTVVRELLSRPWSPDRQLVLSVIDRPPVRELVRALLLDTVLEFARKASAPVAGVAKGLGSLARMAAQTAKARSGSLGALVGAVSGEVERQVEKRAAEVVEAAMGGVFAEIADAVSNPRRASEAAELRLAVFDGVLGLRLPQLARELVNLDVPGGAAVVREGIERWLGSATADEGLRERFEAVRRRKGGRTLREVVEENGLMPAVRSVGVETLAARMGEVVKSEAFAAWLGEVMR